jgi:hypothetical protein
MLLLGAGQQLELYRWGGGAGLTKVSFYDVPHLVTSLDVLNGQTSKYVLAGDLHASLHFVRFLPEGNRLAAMGRDYDQRQAVAAHFQVSFSGGRGGWLPRGWCCRRRWCCLHGQCLLLRPGCCPWPLFPTPEPRPAPPRDPRAPQVNGSRLNFLLGDGSGTVRVLRYDRQHPESWSGRRLLPESGIHTGQSFCGAVRVQLRLQADEQRGQRQAVVLSCRAGSLEVVAPLWHEEEYAALAEVQARLVLCAQHAAGLNPRGFRRRHLLLGKALGARESRFVAPQEVPVLDGELLLEFLWLERAQQERAAAAAGCSAQQVLGLLGVLAARLGML